MATVIGVFNGESQAEKAVRALRDNGFTTNEISVVAKGEEGAAEEDGGLTMGQDLTTGTATGGVLGGVAGLLAGMGALAIPGLGPIVAAGPIAAGLSGAVAGGLAGGLVDWGIPESRGRHFAEEVKHGRVLTLVKTGSAKVDQAAGLLRQNGAQEVEVH
ncbi:MAG: general stress protein [Betaproteobacteria bacterium]